jgi:hypothetical protein
MVLEPDPVILDLEKLLVKRKQLRRVQLPLRKQLLRGVGKDLFTMTESVRRHGSN